MADKVIPFPTEPSCPAAVAAGRPTVPRFAGAGHSRADLPWLGATLASGPPRERFGRAFPPPDHIGRHRVPKARATTIGPSPFHRNYLRPSATLDLLVDRG